MDRIRTFRYEQIDAGYHAVGKSPNVQRIVNSGNNNGQGRTRFRLAQGRRKE